jgi:hypothetical protein
MPHASLQICCLFGSHWPPQSRFSRPHLQVTAKRLRNLTLKFCSRSVSIDGNPKVLFDKHLALIPLLPATHVSFWGVNLFTQCWHALGEALTCKIALLPSHLAIHASTFDLTTMTTKNEESPNECPSGTLLPRRRELEWQPRQQEEHARHVSRTWLWCSRSCLLLLAVL